MCSRLTSFPLPYPATLPFSWTSQRSPPPLLLPLSVYSPAPPPPPTTHTSFFSSSYILSCVCFFFGIPILWICVGSLCVSILILDSRNELYELISKLTKFAGNSVSLAVSNSPPPPPPAVPPHPLPRPPPPPLVVCHVH